MTKSERAKRRREERKYGRAMKPKLRAIDDPNRIKKKTLIAAFAVCGVLNKACEVAGCERKQHRRWLKDDAKYAEEFQLAQDASIDGLELEARRRAVDGTKKVILYKGKPVFVPSDLKNPKSKKEIYVEHEYSDSMLMFLLKGQRPEKYRDNAPKLEVNGALQIKTLDGVNMDDL